MLTQHAPKSANVAGIPVQRVIFHQFYDPDKTHFAGRCVAYAKDLQHLERLRALYSEVYFIDEIETPQF